MRVLIGQKPIEYCASKLIENRAREIFLYRIATHAKDKELYNSRTEGLFRVNNKLLLKLKTKTSHE